MSEYLIRTKDKAYFIAKNGEGLTRKKSEAHKYDSKRLANWYIKGTNVFGELIVVKI